jgi:hypothetical protein
MVPGLKIGRTVEGEELDTSQYPYSEVVGSILYLAHCTRPDISFAVAVLARHMHKPAMQHWETAMELMRYIKGTMGVGITYGGGGGDGAAGAAGHQLMVYGDADWAGDISSRRSTTGFAVVMNGGAISWKSKLQPTVAASTLEAEYMAAASATKEALWVRKLWVDLGMGLGRAPVVIKCDNQGAISQIKNPITSARSKHIDVMHHLVRDRAARGEIVMAYCPTKQMWADILTKALAAEAFRACRAGLGLV